MIACKAFSRGLVCRGYQFAMKNTERAKCEILELFSTEPDDEHIWSEQDIYEQSRKIILKWNETEVHQE